MARYVGRFAAAMLLVVAVAAAARSAQAEKKVGLADVPPPVRAAIVKAIGDGRLVDIGVFAGGKETLYEIEMVVEGKEYDVLFASDGTVKKKSYEGVAGAEDADDDDEVAGNIDGDRAEAKGAVAFQDQFGLEGRKLASTGRSRYFVLEPGYRLVLEGKEGRHAAMLQITVLNETRTIGGIETRVVEERETKDGELEEISQNFLAIDQQSGSVFYFGEDVDMYKNGRVVAHEGAWIHGKNGARAGMMMPGEPALGARFYQEVAPGVAMDRASIVDTSVTLETPAGTFRDCVRTQEEDPLDGEREFKLHAPGIGLVQDEDLLLVKHGFVKL